jgi:hypothetical protein
MRKHQGWALLLALAACASGSAGGTAKAPKPEAKPEDTKVASSTDPNKMICTMERPTGSMIPERICRPKWRIDAERAATQDALRGLSTSTQTSHGQ